MRKIKVAILGSSGMLGSMVKNVLERDDRIQLFCPSREDFDAACVSVSQLQTATYDCDWIINCIGVLNKYIDEKNPESVKNAIRVNALFPYTLAETGKKIIQIATDCAGEPDTYGMTKKLGEVKAPNFINIRCSIVGPGNPTGLLDWFLYQPMSAIVQGYTKAIWNGVTTLAFAKLCYGIVTKNLTLPNQNNFTPHDAVTKKLMLEMFKKYFSREDIKIVSVENGTDRQVEKGDDDLWRLAEYDQVPTVEYLIKELVNYMEG